MRDDEAKKLINSGLSTASKTPSDWRFIRESFFASLRPRLTDIVFGSRYSAGEVYRAMIPIAFGTRIAFRELR